MQSSPSSTSEPRPGPHDVAATLAWAARLRGAAGEAEAVARDLASAACGVGLRGPAGEALQHLVAGRVALLRRLVSACEDAAAALVRAPR